MWEEREMAHGALGGDLPHPPLWDGGLPGGGLGYPRHRTAGQGPEGTGNRIVSILGASDESDLRWEGAVRLVSAEVIVSTLDGSRGEPLHEGIPLSGRLSQSDVDLVVAVGPVKEVERMREVTTVRRAAGGASVHRQQSRDLFFG